MARAAKTTDALRPAPRLRRAYYDCRYGQLHLHNAIPSGGGFDELTSVLCIHDSHETARAFVPLLAPLGIDRSVYAPDLPGFGESDPPKTQSGVDSPIDAAVNALGDFLDSMRIRSVDLVARGDGAEVARRLARLRGAGVRRVVELGTGPATAEPSLLSALGGTQPT